MKKLVLLTGAPGTGKTTVCREFFETTPFCAWLDSDWCWLRNPFEPKTEDQKRYVEGTFGRILRGYLTADGIEIVLFCWVMPMPFMFDLITDQLENLTYEPYKIALVCDRDAHIQRMKADNRRSEQADSPNPMEPYYALGATVVDVTRKTPPMVVDAIKKAIGWSGLDG